MHLAIRYTTHFDYPEPVRQSHNEVRAAPTTDPRQELLAYRMVTDPPARAFTFLDHWGTLVDAFGIRLPHRSLTIDVSATVETSARPDPGDGPAWSALAEPGFTARHWEHLQSSTHVEITPRIEELAGAVDRGGGRPVVAVVDDLVAGVRERLRYESGSTEIGASVDGVLERGVGVCQDYAHVLVAVARAAGIPARYVSGYLYATDDATGADAGDEPVSVQTHAWVELAVPEHGWISRDPTNDEPVGERHVKIGHGRDYDDVTPVKGVFMGGGGPVLTAGVEMRKVLPPEPRPMVPLTRQQEQQQQ